jgi:hypothetical protein
MGNRVWCRFTSHGRILGLQQRLQNLELPLMVVNVFCGNCSTYCEMGIDVRSYAEKEKTLFVPPVVVSVRLFVLEEY